MDNPEMDNLIERIKRVERAIQSCRLAAVVACLATVALLVLRLTPREHIAKSIQAGEFVVVDESGRVLIRLGPAAQAKGRSIAEFYDSAGDSRIVLGIADADVPFVTLTDPDAGHQLVLDVQPQGGSAIAFRNRGNKSGLLLGASTDGLAALGFMDKDGNRLVEMGLNPDSSARLTFRSKEGRRLLELPQGGQVR